MSNKQKVTLVHSDHAVYIFVDGVAVYGDNPFAATTERTNRSQIAEMLTALAIDHEAIKVDDRGELPMHHIGGGCYQIEKSLDAVKDHMKQQQINLKREQIRLSKEKIVQAEKDLADLTKE